MAQVGGTKSFEDEQRAARLAVANGNEATDHQDEQKLPIEDFVTIIHFNDCYNIEPGPKSSGAAGFLTAVNQFRHLNPIILFSGDILSPSFMSTFTKGEQMIPVLNDIGVHCAVFGNHEFDYGVDNLIEFTKRTTFPWLLSNVVDKETSNQLGDGLVYHIIERNGLKFGLIGLIEEEWLSTLSTLDSSDVIYEDFVQKGRELARWLKSGPNHVDCVIALTHFRTPNDIRLADSVPEIDLILGGHDHDYEIIKRPNSYVVKSGTDFREFSLIKLKLKVNSNSNSNSNLNPNQTSAQVANGTSDAVEQATLTSSSNGTTTREKGDEQRQQQGPINEINIERVECVSYEPDPELKSKLEKFVTTIDEKMSKVLGQFNCELDGRFSSIRKFETNLGNFVCDIMLASTHADIAILNSGTLRSDRIHPKGDFTMRDLFNILGYIDPIAVLQATGHDIWQALENGVSQWPKLEGRFPQVSGCSFVFDPSQPPLKRINPKDVLVGEEPLDLDRHYKLTTKAYLASGKDGYDCLRDCKVLVPGDESPDLTTSILNHFEAINIIKSNRRTHHRQSIICLSRSSLKKLLETTTSTNEDEYEELTTAGESSSAKQTNNRPNDDNNNYNSNSRRIESTINEESSDGDQQRTKSSAASSLDGGDSRADSQDEDDDEENKYDQEVADAIAGLGDRNQQQHKRQQHLATGGGARASVGPIGPNASSPLVGSVAPTPTLNNMAQVDSCGGCGSAMPPTPPSTIPRAHRRQPRTKRMMSLYEMECEQCKLEPKIEGRIKILGVNYSP